MSDNPYSAPQTDGVAATVADSDSSYLVASQNKRLVNLIVDQGILYFGSYAIGFALTAVFVASNEVTQEGLRSLQLVATLLGLVLFFVYYVFFEIATGKTIGKFITGTRVIDQGGGSASAGQVMGRTLCRIIPLEAFSFLIGGNSRRPVGWHDSISKTRVIED